MIGSIFRRTPANIVEQYLGESAKAGEGLDASAVLGTIRNRHGYLLARVEAARGTAFRDFAVELLRMLGPLAVAILEAWLRGMLAAPGPTSEFSINGFTSRAFGDRATSAEADDDTTKDYTPEP